MLSDRTPWGESWDELADAVLDDKSAPPVLVLAVFIAKKGDDRSLRGLVRDAVELDEKERGMADETIVQNARANIEDGIWKLMDQGWDDEKILKELKELIEGCRSDM